MNITLDNAIKLTTIKHNIVVEFGVNSGKTIKQIRQTFPNSIKVYGFDSFIGLPEDWIGTNHKKGDMSTNGVVPNIENVTFLKGWFKDTIPQFVQILKQNNVHGIDMIHIDCDLYSSTMDVLNGLIDFISPGCILIFDEWSIHHNRDVIGDEQVAFNEWANVNSIKYKLYDRINDYNEIERQIIEIL